MKRDHVIDQPIKTFVKNIIRDDVQFLLETKDHRDIDRMVVIMKTMHIIINVVSSNPGQAWIASDFRQVGDFLRVFRFHPLIQLTSTI